MNSAPNIEDVNKGKVIMEALALNMKKIDVYESISFIAGGSIAGILGLTNIHGLLFFLFIAVIIVTATAIKASFNLKEYTNMTFSGLLVHSLSSHALSFVLFWTLAYALVYIY